jgi:hypothetical protein
MTRRRVIGLGALYISPFDFRGNSTERERISSLFSAESSSPKDHTSYDICFLGIVPAFVVVDALAGVLSTRSSRCRSFNPSGTRTNHTSQSGSSCTVSQSNSSDVIPPTSSNFAPGGGSYGHSEVSLPLTSPDLLDLLLGDLCRVEGVSVSEDEEDGEEEDDRAMG